MLRIHNSLTDEIEEFQPLNERAVSLYACGPTVWNFAHVGNFRTFVFGDVLRRYLKFKGFQLTHVMNFTDVNDRIIREAARRRVTIGEYTAPFIEAFWEDFDSLGCERPEIAPRATEHIGEVIEIIQTLLEKGHAYQSDGSIYFRIASFPDYGKLSKLPIENTLGGGRVETDKYNKENARDFALWKAVDENDPNGWNAPFGRGRPGWHVECSAMAMKHLGETIDIHTGGVDLQFPHHENEIAQCESATGKPFVRYWLHGEFLKINNEKMSKSLGNEFTLREVVGKGFSPLAIRYLLLSVPFDKQLNFTLENLHGAESTVKRLHDFCRRITENYLCDGSNADFQNQAQLFLTEFEAAMDNNLNTSVALAALHKLVCEANKACSLGVLYAGDRRAILEAFERFNSVFGIFVETKQEILPTEIETLIGERKEARRSRNFARSDEIRALLNEVGIALEDTPDGVKWKWKRR